MDWVTKLFLCLVFFLDTIQKIEKKGSNALFTDNKLLKNDFSLKQKKTAKKHATEVVQTYFLS